MQRALRTLVLSSLKSVGEHKETITLNMSLSRVSLMCLYRTINVIVVFIWFAARKFYEKMGGTLFGILPGYPVFEETYPVACYEWYDVPSWLEKWNY